VNRFVVALVVALVLLGAGVAGLSVHHRREADRRLAEAEVQAAVTAEISPPPDVTAEAVVERNLTFDKVMEKNGVDKETAYQMIQAARPLFKFRRLTAGNKLVLVSSAQGTLRSVRYHIDNEHELYIGRNENGQGFQAEIKEIPSKLEVTGVGGPINGSLFEGVMDAGEQPQLAMEIADIFRWDLDFYTDPRPGDTFRVVVEKRQYENGQPSTYGRILAVEYNNAGHVYQAVLFHDPQGRPAYYAGDGKSLQKAFLRSPLKFAARISSHFSRSRFHPILKIYRPHLGTDYAAPTGTPVQSIASGRVVFAGRNGGGGNTVKILHSNGYETYYMHLSRILVHNGQHVDQGQRVGLVGMTGLATGPHLDFRLQQRGKFVNFERLKLPPALPVAKKDWSEFATERDRLVAIFPSPNTGTTVAKASNAVTTGN